MSDKQNITHQKPNKITAWIIALRPRTLPLALSGIIMGGGLAMVSGTGSLTSFLLCILTALLLQLLSNLANDYGDYKNGADSASRIGPERASQMGWLSIAEMKRGIWLTGTFAFICGLALLAYSVDLNNFRVLGLFLFLGIAGIWAAYNYTAGNNPYGYAGWGDISVMIFFGFIAVWGSYYLVSGHTKMTLVFPSLAIACLSSAVLNLNNMRDIESDKEAGKVTIPVRIGLKKAKSYHAVLMLTPFLCVLLYAFLEGASLSGFLPLLILPVALLFLRMIMRIKELRSFDPYLKKTALFTLAFSLLWVLSYSC